VHHHRRRRGIGVLEVLSPPVDIEIGFLVALRRSARPGVLVLSVLVVEIAPVRPAELALREDYLRRDLHRLLQKFLLARGWLERLALHDPDRGEDAAELRVDRGERLVVHELLELGPVGAVHRIHHVDPLAAAVGELDRLGVLLHCPEGVDPGLLGQCDGRSGSGPPAPLFITVRKNTNTL
jgi:hypothetical protein